MIGMGRVAGQGVNARFDRSALPVKDGIAVRLFGCRGLGCRLLEKPKKLKGIGVFLLPTAYSLPTYGLQFSYSLTIYDLTAVYIILPTAYPSIDIRQTSSYI